MCKEKKTRGREKGEDWESLRVGQKGRGRESQEERRGERRREGETRGEREEEGEKRGERQKCTQGKN